ncbi:MAG: hypothetical protein J6O56_03140 [Bacilli bacterium]|nr:hypothetical protein [Bacilli bacterium]
MLLKLNGQGISPNITHSVKIKINDNGTLSLVDKKIKKKNGKTIKLNMEEYHNPKLICSGEWLYVNQGKFTEEQKQKLRNIGYELQEDKFTLKETFDYHFGLLERLVNQGLSANLSSIDKIKINEDGKLSIVKKKSKKNNGEKIYVNINEYEDTKLIPTGNWLYNNQDKFTEEQKQMLRNVGYILKEDKETFEEKFEYHYSLLERLTTQGLSANLLSDDKIKMDENGLLSIIKPKMKLKNGKAVQVNKEEYFDSSLISSGNWLYVNQSNFTKEQKQKLRQIGYVLKEDILLTDDIFKYNSDSLYKLPFDNIFKYHLNILYKLQEQGFSTNLSAQDKIKINDDRSLSLIKIKTEFVDGKQIRINDEEYNDESLITTGNWLYNNQDKFTEEQKQELRTIGYKLNEDKTFDNSFDYYYGLLEKLVNQGLSANITKDTRLRINDDDTLTIVIRKYKNINKKAVQINKEEYQDKRLVTIGNWLYNNQDKFTEEQKQKLRDIGYVLKEDKKMRLEEQRQKLEELKKNKKGKKLS